MRRDLNRQPSDRYRRLGLSLVINWILPLVAFYVLRGHIGDTNALAVATAIPIVRGVSVLLWRRRLDWVSLIGAISFAITYAVTALSGGSALPLKIYRPVVTGIIGLAFLISVAVRRPLLLFVLPLVRRGDTPRLGDSAMRRRVSAMSLIVGLLFVVDAAVHVYMALALSTGAYLGYSKLVTIAILAVLIGIRWLRRPSW